MTAREVSGATDADASTTAGGDIPRMRGPWLDAQDLETAPSIAMMTLKIMASPDTTQHSARRAGHLPGSVAGVALTVGVCGLFALGGLFAAGLLPWLRYDRLALASHEWWRLLSAHLVHLDLRHGLLNAAALALTAWIAARRVAIGEWLWLAAGSLAAVDIGLYWWSPDIAWYAGASGLLHGLFAGAGVLLVLRARDFAGGLMLLALAAKLTYEHLSGGASLFMGGTGFSVVTEAHLYGALGGLATALLILARRVRL